MTAKASSHSILARWRALAINDECFGFVAVFLVLLLFFCFFFALAISSRLSSVSVVDVNLQVSSFQPAKYFLLLAHFVGANAL